MKSAVTILILACRRSLQVDSLTVSAKHPWCDSVARRNALVNSA